VLISASCPPVCPRHRLSWNRSTVKGGLFISYYLLLFLTSIAMNQLPVPWEDVRQALEFLRDLAPDPDLTVSKYIEGVTQTFRPAWSLLYPRLQNQVYNRFCTIHQHILPERKRRNVGKNLSQFGILQDDLVSFRSNLTSLPVSDNYLSHL